MAKQRSVAMTAIHRRHHALLDVSNVLNSQRRMDSMWQAYTECIKGVVSWEWAGVLLYAPEEGTDRLFLYVRLQSEPEKEPG
jgi:hypothetical protein